MINGTVNIEQAARILNCCSHTVRAYIKKGLLHGVLDSDDWTGHPAYHIPETEVWALKARREKIANKNGGKRVRIDVRANRAEQNKKELDAILAEIEQLNDQIVNLYIKVEELRKHV